MAKGSKFEEMARDAARNIEAARQTGQQLSLLPDTDDALTDPGDGRPPRGKGKATSMLRDWLAARGMRLPEQQLAEIAGLTARDDVFLTAMARTEQVLAWAEEGAIAAKGAPARATLGQRLAMFQVVFASMIRSAEALLPYGLSKVTPDEQPQAAVQVFVAPGGSAAVQPAPGPDQARDVTPRPARLSPPPLPGEIMQNQQVAECADRRADAPSRTE